MTGAGISGGNSNDHARLVQLVNRLDNQVLRAIGAAAQAHVSNIKAVFVSGFQGVKNIFGTRVRNITGENAIVTEQRSWRDPGNEIRNLDTIKVSRGVGVTGHRPGNVRA